MNKLTEHHILLDMDGVLSNFVAGVERIHDCDLSDLKGFRIDKHLGIGAQEFWSPINKSENFWATLEPYPWARDLVNHCLEKTSGNVTIVTSPDMSVSTYSQKAYWISQHFPSLMRKFFIGPEKHLMAKPNHVLIDDSDSNIEKFRNHGGVGVLFPQPWNKSAKQWKPGTVIQNLNYLLQLNVTGGAELN